MLQWGSTGPEWRLSVQLKRWSWQRRRRHGAHSRCSESLSVRSSLSRHLSRPYLCACRRNGSSARAAAGAGGCAGERGAGLLLQASRGASIISSRRPGAPRRRQLPGGGVSSGRRLLQRCSGWVVKRSRLPGPPPGLSAGHHRVCLAYPAPSAAGVYALRIADLLPRLQKWNSDE